MRSNAAKRSADEYAPPFIAGSRKVYRKFELKDGAQRRRLADLLARPASKFLAEMLQHVPLARNDLEHLGDVLTERGLE
jgi:hypothetical protein